MDGQVNVSQDSGKQYYIYVTIFLVVLAAIGGMYIISSGKKDSVQTSPLPTPIVSGSISPSEEPSASGSGKTITMENGLKIQDEVEGTGAEAVSGKKVTVNYKGTLENGTKFDSSYDRNQPFAFTLGTGEVIKGWDEGVAGMKVGGKRKLTIPSALGYGEGGITGVIPGGATLIFEVELLKVE